MDRQDFHHPFTPYDIQLQFMRALYASLEDGKVAVFESPTGKRASPPSLGPGLTNVGAGTVSAFLPSPQAGHSPGDSGETRCLAVSGCDWGLRDWASN